MGLQLPPRQPSGRDPRLAARASCPTGSSTDARWPGIYDELLGDVEELDLPVGPDADPRRRDVFQNYTVMTDRRDELVEHLHDDGIEILISWPVPFHKQPGSGLEHWTLPNTERLCRRVLSLPMNAELEDSQVEFVADSVHRFFGAGRRAAP